MSDREIRIKLFHIGKQPVSGNNYPREVVQKAIEKFNAKQDGWVTMMPNPKVFLAHVIGTAKLELESDTVMADMKILAVPHSDVIWEEMQADRARFFPVGFGTTVNGVVQDDYEISHIALGKNDDER